MIITRTIGAVNFFNTTFSVTDIVGLLFYIILSQSLI